NIPYLKLAQVRVHVSRVEIGGLEPASLVRHEWIDACNERLRLSRVGDVPPLQMASDSFIADRLECLVRAAAALDPWLLTDTSNPFVVARRRVACLTGLWVLPSARKDLVTTPKGRTKQGDLLNIGKRRRTRNGCNLRSQRGRHLNRAALLQL